MWPGRVPRVLAQVSEVVSTSEPDQQWTEQAVILIGREVERLVVDANE